jgi:hypothetical protein
VCVCVRILERSCSSLLGCRVSAFNACCCTQAYRDEILRLPRDTPRLPFLPLVVKDLRFIVEASPELLSGQVNFERSDCAVLWFAVSRVCACV